MSDLTRRRIFTGVSAYALATPGLRAFGGGWFTVIFGAGAAALLAYWAVQ